MTTAKKKVAKKTTKKKTAAKKKPTLTVRVSTLEKDMLAMNEMVSMLMMGKLLQDIVAEVQVYINTQGPEKLGPLAMEWLAKPSSLQEAIQQVMRDANEQFRDRESGMLVWEELRGYMRGRLLMQLEPAPEPPAPEPAN